MANLRAASNIVNNAPDGYQSWEEVIAQQQWNTLSTQEKIQTKLEYEKATGITIPEIYGATGDMIPWEQLSSEAQYQHMSSEDKAITASEYEQAGGFLPWTSEIGKTIHQYTPETSKGVVSGIADVGETVRKSTSLPFVERAEEYVSSKLGADHNLWSLRPEDLEKDYQMLTGKTADITPNTKYGDVVRDTVPWLLPVPGSKMEKATAWLEENAPRGTKVVSKVLTRNAAESVAPTVVQDDRQGKDFSLQDYAENVAINTGGELGLRTLAAPLRPVVRRVVKSAKAYEHGESQIAAKLDASKELYTASQGGLFETIANHLMQKEGRNTISPNEVLDAWAEVNPEMEEIGQIDNIRENVFGDEADAELTPTMIQSRITTALAEAENNFLDVSINQSESGARSAMDALIDSEDNKKFWQLSLNPLRNNREVLKELGAGPIYRNSSRILGIGEKGLLGAPKLARGANATEAITATLETAKNNILNMVDSLTTRIAETVNEGRNLTGVAKLEHDAKVQAFVEQKKQAKKMLRAVKQAKSRKVNLENLYSYYTEAQQALFDNPYLIKGEVTETLTQKVRDSLEEVMNLREMSKGASLDAGDLVGLGLELIPHAASLGTTLAGAITATASKQILDKAFIRDLRLGREMSEEASAALRFDDKRFDTIIELMKEHGASEEEIDKATEEFLAIREGRFEDYVRYIMEERRAPLNNAIHSASKIATPVVRNSRK